MLKKFLGSEEDGAKTSARLAGMILEAVACHAVELDPVERESFQASLRKIVAKMEASHTGVESLVLVGEAISSIEVYNRGVQRSLNARMKELQSILGMFTRSLLQVSKTSATSSTKLSHIERQIEKSFQSDDLRLLKLELEKSLETICEEAAEQERRSTQIGDQIRETMSRPESAAVLSEAVADLDLATGLPNFRAATTAIGAAIVARANAYAILFSVNRVAVINTRFGFAIGDKILMLFGQHVAQRLLPNDQLYRWRGPSFLALVERDGPEMPVRAEIARLVSARLEQTVELGDRSVLLPIDASWMLVSLANSSVESISKKLDAFLTAQSGGSQS